MQQMKAMTTYLYNTPGQTPRIQTLLVLIFFKLSFKMVLALMNGITVHKGVLIWISMVSKYILLNVRYSALTGFHFAYLWS